MKAYASIVALALVAGCGGGGGGVSSTTPPTTQTAAPSPTPTSSAPSSQSPQASTSTLTLQSPAAQQFSVTESGYHGTFTESDNCNPYTGQIAAVATTADTSGSAMYSVSPVGAGTCNITVSDSSGHTTSVQVSITTAAITVQ